uniref:Uncharacterized protein n=1 Tax=Anopheles dirus TaxID=7168 RepID=A0A182NVN8_9DIPT
MENQSLVPTGNPEQDLVTPTRSSVATSRTPQSSEAISAFVKSSEVNRGHRPSQFVTTGHDLPQDDGSVGEIEPLPRPMASAGPSSSARVNTDASVEHSLRVEPGPTPSLHNPQPCRDGDASCVGASSSANHVDLELLEIELKMKELQLQQQRIELEKRRAHLQAQGGNKEMFGEISDIAVARRVKKLNEWLRQIVLAGHRQASLDAHPLLSTLPPYTRQGPLHSTSRFAATVPPGNVTSNRYNTGDYTTLALNQTQLYARQGNLRDLPPFSGRPEEWATFVSNLERTKAMYGYIDEENIERLSKALRGKAREMVGLLLTSNDLPQVMNVLRRHFGRPEIIVHCLIRKIRQLPVPKLQRI